MRVLLAYDGSNGAEAARELLGHLRLPARTQIAVIAALESGPDLFGAPETGVIPADAHEAERRLVKDLDMQLWNIAALLRAPDRSCETRVLRGRAATALVDEAKRWNADLLVIGSRGHGPLESLLLGSVSAEVVDHAPCPVLVARRPGVRRLLLAVDGSESAHRAVATLASWQLLHAVPATVLAVLEPMPAWPVALGGAFAPSIVELGDQTVDDRHERLRAAVAEAVATLHRAGMIAEGEIREGDPAHQIVKASADHAADLVVVGTRGLGTLGRLLLGSVARKVLLHTDASVLVVRPVREAAEVREPARRLAAV
jgi:nucleotide-binding universal stress UspA family protein